jgi:hypothetical protein
MAALIPFLLSSVLLVASPGSEGDSPPGNNEQQNQALTDAQAFSVAAGRILGAASACEQIDRGRVSTAVGKATALAASAAADDDEASTAQQMMKASAVMGRQAVQEGKADCNIVEASFAKLETIEQQQPMDEDQQQDQ